MKDQTLVSMVGEQSFPSHLSILLVTTIVATVTTIVYTIVARPSHF